MMMGNGFGWMWLFGLLVLVGIVLLIVVAVRALGGGISRGAPPSASGGSTAREVLDERYARGELTSDEYRERLRTLDEGR
jgi:putative membrane protein